MIIPQIVLDESEGLLEMNRETFSYIGNHEDHEP